MSVYSCVLPRAKHNLQVGLESLLLLVLILAAITPAISQIQMSNPLPGKRNSAVGWELTGPLGLPWLLSQTPVAGTEVIQDTAQSAFGCNGPS